MPIHWEVLQALLKCSCTVLRAVTPLVLRSCRRAFDSSGLMFKFVIGKTTDEKKEAELQEEIRLYDDFMRLDVAEGYVDLNRKT